MLQQGYIKCLTIQRRFLRYIAWGFLFLLLFSFFLYFGRNILLDYFVSREVSRLETERGVSVRYGDIRLNGLREVQIDRLVVWPEGADTLLVVRSASVGFRLRDLLLGDLDISELRCSSLRLTAVRHGGHANYDFLFRKASAPAAPAERDFGRQADRLLSLLFRVLPEKAVLDDVLLSYVRDSSRLELSLPRFREEDGHFREEFRLLADGQHFRWMMEGELIPEERRADVWLRGVEGAPVRMPGLARWDTDVAFGSLRFSLEEERRRGITSLRGRAEVEQLRVDNRLLAPTSVSLRHAALEYEAGIGKDYVELSDRSAVEFNGFDFHPSVRVQKPAGGEWKIRMGVDKPFFPAQQFFDALPDGLFHTLSDLQCKGEWQYHFLFDADFAQLDSLILESQLTARGFSITDYGTSGLPKLNEDFLYTAYEDDRPVRSFRVGPLHPGFLPLDSIPELLQQAVMQSEDGSFYSHLGFRPDALRQALIHDLRLGRFARGGSTISMQLVKNVYLNRHKNLLRKLEEAILTWLIEHGRISSKRRMYEVYLNICEWGPGVYGIREATHFYFSKEPSALTPSEAIYLASIVPRPKRYRWVFSEDGRLSPRLEGYFRQIAGLLAARGVLTEEQASAVSTEAVRLTGDAAKIFETHPSDSVEVGEDLLPDMLPEERE